MRSSPYDIDARDDSIKPAKQAIAKKMATTPNGEEAGLGEGYQKKTIPSVVPSMKDSFDLNNEELLIFLQWWSSTTDLILEKEKEKDCTTLFISEPLYAAT